MAENLLTMKRSPVSWLPRASSHTPIIPGNGGSTKTPMAWSGNISQREKTLMISAMMTWLRSSTK